MTTIRIQQAAALRLDAIYRYTRDRWGSEHAERYSAELFAAFNKIETRGVLSRPIPAELGVVGNFFRHEQHIIYWRHLSNGDIGIVTILHTKMHQIGRLRDDFGL